MTDDQRRGQSATLYASHSEIVTPRKVFPVPKQQSLNANELQR